MPTTQLQAAYGWASALGLARENVYGTAVAPTLYLPATDDAMAYTNKLIPRMGSRKTVSDTLANPGQIDVKGSFSIEAEPNVIGQVLGICLGTDSVSGTGAYTHIMHLYAPRPSFTLSADYGGGSVHQWVGCVADSVDISAKAGGLLELKVGVIAQNDVILASQSLSPTFGNANPFDYQLVTSASLNSLPLTNMDSFSISLKNNMQPFYGSGSGRLVRNINPKNAQVTGSFSATYESDAIANLALGATAVPFQINFTHTAIASGSTPYSVSFICPNVIVTSAPLSPKRNDVVTYAVKFNAYESATGAADALKAVVVDTGATAYAP
jgi:hypothetical protein